MKIRNRITVIFTILTSSIILTTFIVILIFSYSERTSFFKKRLNDRSEITEKYFLEIDSADKKIRQKIIDDFNQRLPNELELVCLKRNLNDSLIKQNWQLIPKGIKNQLKENKSVFFSSNSFDGIAKIYTINSQQYIVIVLAQDIYGLAYLNKLKYWMLTALTLGALFAFIISRLLAKQILKPIARKIKKANNIGANNLNERLQVINPNDEIGLLAAAFNNMLDRLESSFDLQQNFVRYASHELKNPLAVIMGESEILLSKKRSINEYITTTEKINQQADKLNKLVNQFLSLSKVKSQNIIKEKVSVDELIFELIQHFKNSYHSLDIKLNLNSKNDENEWLIKANYELIKNAFQNIIENAIKFSEEKPIVLDLKSDEKHIVLSVKDNGPGIHLEDANKVFEPLYRSKNTNHIEGTGLGLSIVKNIIYQHDGHISINHNYKEGCEFIVKLNKIIF